MISPNRYEQIIERIFFSNYEEGMLEVTFNRQEIVEAAQELGIDLPKNLGDVIYSFRYRKQLPDSIREKAPQGCSWVIRSIGRSRYSFAAVTEQVIMPNLLLAETKVPDATPGVVTMYCLSDEQALLARLRYNRLIDIFTGITCYSLQNHLRTTVPNIGQVETDELYIGVNRQGIHYVFPVQAKGGKDKLSIVQIEQDIALCASKFPALICYPIAAQFMANDLIALFQLELSEDKINIQMEKHYRLVSPENISLQDLENYKKRLNSNL